VKPSYDDCMKSVDLLIELVPFFPNSVAARCTVCAEIFSFVSSQEHLDWFTDAYMRTYTKWAGFPTLRALFNTRFAPADGVMPSVNVPGHTTEELEAKYQANMLEENTRREEEFRRQKQLAASDEFQAFPLPDVKRLN
jgi:hypothetical protein